MCIYMDIATEMSTEFDDCNRRRAMMNLDQFCAIGILILHAWGKVSGHGMLMDPVNRGSMWRLDEFKGKTLENYNDNENYCGGRETMWIRNKGQCGPCGDNYALAQPRPSENGGKYGRGIIVKRYSAGSLITVTARITVHHKGHFEFAVCPLFPDQLETESCFEKYPLQVVQGSSTKYALPNNGKGNYTVVVKLPDSLKCEQCALRWQYVAGNNPGATQETFRTCSDVAIQ